MHFLQRRVWNVWWSRLDGVISGFPNTYASKVGKTSDASYKACLADLLTTRSEHSLSFRPAFPASCRCTAHHFCHPAARIRGVLRACVVPLLQPSMHYTLQPGQGAFVCCFARLEHICGRPNICLLGEESPCASLCASSSNPWSFLMYIWIFPHGWVLCSRTRGEVGDQSTDVMVFLGKEAWRTIEANTICLNTFVHFLQCLTVSKRQGFEQNSLRTASLNLATVHIDVHKRNQKN